MAEKKYNHIGKEPIVYERTLQVTQIIHIYKEQSQYTFEQFKKREEVFKLTCRDKPGLFDLGDIVTLRIGTDLDWKETVM